MSKSKARLEFEQKCKKGKHSLTGIFEVRRYEGDGMHNTLAICWCSVCGSIVIDFVDNSGRTFPGGYASMRYPKILGNKMKNKS